VQDRRVSTEFPEAKRLLGAVANSRGYRHEENVNRLVQVAQAMTLPVGAALLASADGYTPRANAALGKAREELGTITEIANALADNLPAPKLTARKSRRRRRKRKGQSQAQGAQPQGAQAQGTQGDGARPGEAAAADGSRQNAESAEPVPIPVETKDEPTPDAADEAAEDAA
jgi:hypothetical protein